MTFVCEFVGGPLDGYMPLDEAEKLTTKRSRDWSKDRARGRWVPRQELDNRPEFDGYVGPMWGYTRTDVKGNTVAILRYETWEVYNMLSE